MQKYENFQEETKEEISFIVSGKNSRNLSDQKQNATLVEEKPIELPKCR